MYEKPKIQVETSACKTIYKIGEYKIELWVIVGGEPCLDFSGYGYSKRYPIMDQRWVGTDFSKDGFPETGLWVKATECFKHQDPKNIQGPTYDILPKGLISIYEFLDEMLPKKLLRESRLAQFPSKSVISKRYRDKEEHTFFRLIADVSMGRVSPVTISSSHYDGRMEEKIAMPCVSKTWQDYAAFVNPIFDGKFPVKDHNSEGCMTLDNLTEDQFQTMLKLYKKLIA